VAVLDFLCEVRAPFDPERTVDTFAGWLYAYGVQQVTGDRYAGEWPATRFRRHHIEYRSSESTKSEIYQAFLPLVTGAQCELLDVSRLTGQLLGLERKTTRSGRDVIDHAPRAHDDVINAAAGALLLATTEAKVTFGYFRSHLLD
jgi:hypothetical protein